MKTETSEKVHQFEHLEETEIEKIITKESKAMETLDKMITSRQEFLE